MAACLLCTKQMVYWYVRYVDKFRHEPHGTYYLEREENNMYINNVFSVLYKERLYRIESDKCHKEVQVKYHVSSEQGKII